MDPTVFRISRSQDHIIRVVNPNPNPNIDGNFTTSKIINGNIVNLSSETGSFSYVSSDEIDCYTGTMEMLFTNSLKSKNAEIDNLTCLKNICSSGPIKSDMGIFTEVTGDIAKFRELSVNKINLESGFSSDTGNFKEIGSDTGHFKELKSDSGFFTEVSGKSLTFTEASINKLNLEIGQFKEIKIDSGIFTKTTSDTSFISTLTSVSGNFDKLNSNTGTITDLTTDILNTDTVKTNSISSKIGSFGSIKLKNSSSDLDTYDNGSLIISMSGLWNNNITGTINYTKIGQIVTLELPNLTGKSSISSKITLSGFINNTLPSRNCCIPIPVIDSGSKSLGIFTSLSNKITITLFDGSDFSGTGTCGLINTFLTYRSLN